VKVLWIEDNEDIPKAFSSFLKKNGVMVSEASCGAAALRRLARDAFDVVLLDLDLPDVSGVELAKQIRAAGISTPVVVLTGFPAPTSAFEAGQLGMSCYLEKPIDPQKLFDRLISATTGSIDEATNPHSASPPIVGHVRDRIAAIMVRGALASVDLSTIAKLGKHVGVAQGTFKGWCATAQIAPKDVLLFTRILRAINLQRTSGKPIEQNLEIADRRTIGKILLKAGLEATLGATTRISAGEFMASQHLVTDDALLASVSQILTRTIPDIFS
jgi:CheY-like chemotaxis protein